MACSEVANGMKIPRTKAYSDRLAQEFQQLLQDEKLTNFTIHTSTRSFRCHQAILAVVSPVLKAMLQSNMIEASKQEVELDHISGDVMDIVLTYIYTGETYVPEEYLLATLEASDFLDLLELKEYCLKEAVRVCRPSDALSTFKLADALNIDVLKLKCLNFISSSLAEISKLEEFQRLRSTELSSFLSFAQKPYVDPDDLLEATLNWIEHRPDERITSMEDLVQKIDMAKCSVECLESALLKHETLLSNCPKAHILFTKNLVQIVKQGGSRNRCRSRQGRILKAIVVGGNDEDKSVNKQCWELTGTGFVELCRIPPGTHTRLFAVCATPTGFAVTGGANCRRCSVFDISTAKWESKAHLQQARSEHGAACVKGKILVLGGRIAGCISSSVQVLNMEGGEWEDGPNMPYPVLCPEVVSAVKGLFLLDTYSSNRLFFLNIETMKWSVGAPVPSPCYGARMVRAYDQLIVAGGSDGVQNSSRVFALYNIRTNTWSTGSLPSHITHYLGATFCDNRKLYLFGGCRKDRVEEYNMDTESWSVSDINMPRKLANMHALVVYY